MSSEKTMYEKGNNRGEKGGAKISGLPYIVGKIFQKHPIEKAKGALISSHFLKNPPPFSGKVKVTALSATVYTSKNLSLPPNALPFHPLLSA